MMLVIIEQAVGAGPSYGNDELDIASAEQLGKLASGLNARNVPLGLAHDCAGAARRWPNGRGCSPASAPITSSRPRPPPWPGRSR